MHTLHCQTNITGLTSDFFFCPRHSYVMTFATKRVLIFSRAPLNYKIPKICTVKCTLWNFTAYNKCDRLRLKEHWIKINFRVFWVLFFNTSKPKIKKSFLKIVSFVFKNISLTLIACKISARIKYPISVSKTYKN